MTCSFCAEENVPNIPSNGDCCECGYGVCTEPSQRQDRRIHGWKCRCGGCRKLTCISDLIMHSETVHRQKVTSCFPKHSGVSGGGTLRSSIDHLAYDDEYAEPTLAASVQLSEFLNFTSPGTQQLLAPVSMLGQDLYQIEELPGNHTFIAFQPTFFSSDRVERLLFLAARIVKDAMSNHPDLVTEAISAYGFSVSDILVINDWRNVGPGEEAEQVRALLPGRRDYEQGERLRRLLDSGMRPTKSLDVAAWIVGANSQMEAASGESEEVASAE